MTLATGGAHAAESEWTMATAEQAALARAPDVRRAEADLRVAGAYRSFAKLPVVGNPVVSARALVGRPDDPAATYSLMVGLPFALAPRRRAWDREASAMIDAATFRLGAVKNDVRRDAREAYAAVATARALRTLANEGAETAAEIAARVRARLQAGAATALDQALADQQAAEAKADVARAERALAHAEGRFRRVLALPANDAIDVAPLAAPAVEQRSLEAVLKRANEARSEPRAWSSTAERYRRSDRRLFTDAVGPLTVGLDGEQQANINPNRSVGASVALELPFVQRNQGERAVARQNASSAEVEREIATRTIERDVVAVYAGLAAAVDELAVLDRDAMPSAERTLAMIRTLLDAGAVDSFRLLTARASAYAIRRRRLEVLQEAWLGRIALDHAMGDTRNQP